MGSNSGLDMYGNGKMGAQGRTGGSSGVKITVVPDSISVNYARHLEQRLKDNVKKDKALLIKFGVLEKTK